MTEYANMAEELLSHLPMRSFMAKSLIMTPPHLHNGQAYHMDWIMKDNRYAEVVNTYIPEPSDILFMWSRAIERANRYYFRFTHYDLISDMRSVEYRPLK